MRRADRKRPSKSVTTSSIGASAAYTTGQREQIRRGLRILARMIVRAHLRWEALGPHQHRQSHSRKERLADEPLMGDGDGNTVAHEMGGDARDTRYGALANPLRFPRLAGGRATAVPHQTTGAQ